MAFEFPGRIGSMAATKSLGVQDNDRARRVFTDLVETDFDGVHVKAAKALRVSQPTVSDFIAGRSGYGPKLMKAVARYDMATALRMLGLDPQEDPAVSAIREKLMSEGVPGDVARWSARAGVEYGSVDPEKIARLLVAIGVAFAQPGSTDAPVPEAAPTARRPRDQ